MAFVLFVLKHIPVLFVGGLLTSVAEHYFNYNLFELIKEKLFPAKKV